mgnify:CR=1 FL=1
MFDKAIQFVLTFLTIKQILKEVNREATGTEADAGERGARTIHGDSPTDTGAPEDPSQPTI